MNELKKSHISRWMILGFVVMGIASFGGLAAMIAIAVDKIRSGKGLDTYRTTWLVEFNYVGILVLFGAIIVALLIGGYLRLREHKEWRELDRKYGNGKDHT
ncbi:hypothetical protein [Noviherbaspirillum sp. ST9]|uniref:hypothetical protein n=1 Tax=Noviherbaspirillum sp. ST9 TaxID=3401606 RepID=UPI003B58762B